MLRVVCLIALVGSGLANIVVRTQNRKAEAKDSTACLGICHCDEAAGVVDCSNAQLHKMPPYLPCWAKHLYLNDNLIREVDSSALRCMASLVTLELGNNDIMALGNDTFENLPALKSLILRENQISVVEGGTFAAVSETLEKLDMTKNSWASIPQSTFQVPMPNLKTLRLTENGIKELQPSMFVGLPSLRVLNLNTNVISSLGSLSSRVLEGLTSLEELYLGNNFFANIPGQNQFEPVKHSLRVLSFPGHFRISTVPKLSLPALEELDVSGCGLKKWTNDTLANMTALLKLDLSYNQIQMMEARSLQGPNRLTHLDVSFSSLLAFPYRALSAVPSLERIEANGILLQRLGPAPTFIPENFLENLRHLSLEYNSVKSVDDKSFLATAGSLKTLILSYTALDYVPPVLGNMESLDELVFNGNPITNLSAASFPTAMPNLASLEISSSPMLADVGDRAFSSLVNLKSITLSDNKMLFSVSPTAFDGLDSLAAIDFTNNAMETGFSQWCEGKSVSSFLFAGNALNCDCNARDFHDWLASDQYLNIVTKDAVVCYTPRMIRDRPLVSVGADELTCDYDPCPEQCLCYQNQQSTIIGVDCSEAQLTNVPPNLPVTSQLLRLDKNAMSSLENGSLENLTAVESLYLSSNQLSAIDSATFLQLTALKQLYLQDNRMQSIDSLWFSSLSLLEEIRLDSNWLSTLGADSFLELTLLRVLDASKNNLQGLEENTFTGLGRVETLVLADNAIAEIHPSAFAPLKSLRVLYLASNRISSLPKSCLADLLYLVNVDLTENRLVSLQPRFLSSPSLLVLNLEANLVASVEEMAFSDLTKLQTIRLGGNQIVNVSSDAFAVQNGSQVVNLDLSSNSLTRIPAYAFQSLAKLENLYLDSNPIASLDANPDFLNKSQSYLPRLAALHIAFTQVEEVAANGSFLALTPGLKSLVMSGCMLGRFPSAALELLPELDDLVLDANQIANISAGDVLSHASLKTLSLRFMSSLVRIENESFSGLPHLTSLKLSEGGLTYVGSDAFRGLTNLKTLDLSKNQLSFPDYRWFDGLDPDTLASVSLWGNPWRCDRAVVEYERWLQDAGSAFHASSLDVICYDPVYLKGMSVQDLAEILGSTAPIQTTEATAGVTQIETTVATNTSMPMRGNQATTTSSAKAVYHSNAFALLPLVLAFLSCGRLF